MSGVKLFKILKTKIGEHEADALITYVDDSINDNKKEFHEMIQNTFATKVELKEEIGKVRMEIAGVRGDLAKVEGGIRQDLAKVEGGIRQDLAKVEGGIRGDLAKVEGRLETKISDVKSDVLRWMFAFFVTMILAILGLYLKK